jgi:hypothetical protein
MAKPRGRPRRDGDTVKADTAIAKAVNQLLMWGFSGEAEVYSAVANAARAVLQRTDHGGFALGPDRIKKLFEQHRPPALERYWPSDSEITKRIKPLRQRHLWTKESLCERRPSDAPIAELAEILLSHGGDWPWSDAGAFRGELEPSRRWAASLSFGPKRRK